MELPNPEPFGLEPLRRQKTPPPAAPSSTTPTIPVPPRANLEEEDDMVLQALSSIRWQKEDVGRAGVGETSQVQTEQDKPAEPQRDDPASSTAEKEKNPAQPAA